MLSEPASYMYRGAVIPRGWTEGSHVWGEGTQVRIALQGDVKIIFPSKFFVRLACFSGSFPQMYMKESVR